MLKPIILDQIFMRGTIDAFVAEPHRYLYYNRSSYHIVSRYKTCMMTHSLKLPGHPGVARVYANSQQTCYLFQMFADVSPSVHTCVHWAKIGSVCENELVLLNYSQLWNCWKLWELTFLDPLPKSRRGLQYTTMIADQLSKLEYVVSMRRNQTVSVVQTILNIERTSTYRKRHCSQSMERSLLLYSSKC